MNDDAHMIPIEDLHFQKKTTTLPPELIDRITLIHHVFRDYLSATLDETIENFKYDTDPESEIRVWEHMASVVLALKYQFNWPPEKMIPAVKVVLGLSMGSIQDNSLDASSTEQIMAIWTNRKPH